MPSITRLSRLFHQLPFKRQLVLIVMFGVLAIAILSALGSSWQGSRQIRQTLMDQGQRVAESLARQSRLALLSDSAENAADAVSANLAFPDIVLVEILHVDGHPLISKRKDLATREKYRPIAYPDIENIFLEHETDDAWSFIAPVFSKDVNESPFQTGHEKRELLGHVRVVQSKTTLKRLMADVFAANLAIALIFFLFFLVTVHLLTDRLTHPLTKLSEAMARAERGEPSVRADISGPSDIVEMAHAFNSMMKVLEEREQELRKARDDALKFARLKAEFAATVSHEIRTPLNGVIGTLDMLMATNLPPRQRQFVEIAWDSSQYLLDLINNILDFSKLEAGKLELEQAEFDVARLIEEIVELFAQQAHQKGLELGYVIARDVPPRVKGDARRIRQVLINLVGNAIKFTDAGEVAIRIHAKEHASQRLSLRFEVRDTGIGIDDEMREHVFESFTQADTSTTRRYSGSGLGLAICKQLVGLMGGEIGAESIPGTGSCFWFMLPLAAASPAVTAPTNLRHSGHGQRILIVEDSAVVRHFLEQSLDTCGYNCRSAQTANEAMAALREASAVGTPFGVIIMDVVFATVAGGELSTQIRAESSLRNTGLIVMNRYGADTLPAAAQADAYLAKPLRLDRLLECVTTLLGDAQPLTVDTTAATVTDAAAKLRHVLVVEDNRTNQAVAQAMLTMLGCQPEVAADGHEALRAYKRRRWDMILMDCNMPEVDGYQVTAAMRAQENESGTHTPIVAMTANTQRSDIDRCIAAGMDDHLPKPLTLGSLAAKIRRWMPGHAVEIPHHVSLAQEANAPTEPSGPLDPMVFAKLREVLGDGIGQTIQPFLEDMPAYIEQMRVTIANGDADGLRRAAHAVKGASGNLGATLLSNAAKAIEDKAASELLTGAPELLEHLRGEYALARQALLAELKTEHERPTELASEGALVLVVDDDRSTRSALRYALQRSGFRIEEAADGAQALALVDRVRPDVILMDALMPVMDGFTACAKLQETQAGKDIPVLMITALEDTKSIERAFAAGASDYISKPIHLAVVNQRVKRVIEATQAELHVRQLAYNDVLTGLPNRILFNDYLNESIARAKTSGQALAVLFLDLDRFKFVNDTLGHESGDRLLKSVARRIKHCVRNNDCVARLGGDEFTVVIDELPSPAAASGAAQKISRALAAPFEIGGHDIFVSASIGISLYPNDGTDISTLLRHADTAMYRAKKNNAGFQFYEAGMEESVSEHLRMENALRHALDRGELVLHYQPVVEMRSGLLTGAEALVRWHHPTLGIIAPSEFIPIAEETGLIIPIGEWVLRTACQQARRWLIAGDMPNMRMAVNLSGTQLKQGRFTETLETILKETGLDPHHLTLEITESVLMERARETDNTLTQLHELGVSLAIDDFGTGYSSLSYLKRFPVDALKIDRTFTAEMTSNADDASIVTGIIALAHSLRLQVVAEGVETKAQHDFLANLDCDFIQGYFLSESLPADKFEHAILSIYFPSSIFGKRSQPV